MSEKQNLAESASVSHFNQSQSTSEPNTNETQNSPKWFNCKLCAYKRRAEINLIKHIIRRHGTSEEPLFFKCKQCTYQTVEEVNLRKHLFQCHKSPEMPDWFQCDYCMYRNLVKRNLKKHVARCHAVRNVPGCSSASTGAAKRFNDTAN